MLKFNDSLSYPAQLDADQLPDNDACLAYEQRGWHITGPIISDDLLENARADLSRYLSGVRDAQLPALARQMDWQPSDAEPIQIYGYLSLQMLAFRDLVSHPMIAASAARLARTSTIRLFHDRLIIKPSGLPVEATETGWHSDIAYWGSASSNNLITAWIPLSDYDDHSGTLAVIDGSHRWPISSLKRRFLDRDINGTVPAGMVPNGQEVHAHSVPVRAGQVIFHHCNLLHRSVPNRGEQPRIALAVHLQDEGNRYQPWIQANGRPAAHSNDLLCRQDAAGRPDYTDPVVFPMLWPRGT